MTCLTFFEVSFLNRLPPQKLPKRLMSLRLVVHFCEQEHVFYISVAQVELLQDAVIDTIKGKVIQRFIKQFDFPQNGILQEIQITRVIHLLNAAQKTPV